MYCRQRRYPALLRCLVAALRRLGPNLRLDGGGEFGERSGQSVVLWRFSGDLVVTSSQILNESVAGHDGSRRSVTLEAAHRSQPGF
jgi:hypothetical protein